MIDTNQCDELARDIFIADNHQDPNVANEWEAFKDIGGVCGADYAHNIADRLHAAGYRKPRTVGTIEEVDSLAVGSAVLSPTLTFQGRPVVLQRHSDGWRRTMGDEYAGIIHPDYFLPATVLHESGAEVGA